MRQQQQQRSAFSSTTVLRANVLRLSDPQSELLEKVDVFIFDCDGVIWRVRDYCGCVKRLNSFLCGANILSLTYRTLHIPSLSRHLFIIS